MEDKGYMSVKVMPERGWGMASPVTIKADTGTDVFEIKQHSTGAGHGLYSIYEIKTMRYIYSGYKNSDSSGISVFGKREALSGGAVDQAMILTLHIHHSDSPHTRTRRAFTEMKNMSIPVIRLHVSYCPSMKKPEEPFYFLRHFGSSFRKGGIT